MSAFLVETKTIDRILTALDNEARQDSWITRELAERLDLFTSVFAWKDALGKMMLDLNQAALGQRYGDEKTELSYSYTPTLVSPIQAIKSLQCWLYQCMEGNVPESKLYHFFDEVVLRRLMTRVIDRTPEYDQAEWA